MYASTIKVLALSLLLTPITALYITPTTEHSTLHRRDGEEVNVSSDAQAGGDPATQLAAILSNPSACSSSSSKECVTAPKAVQPILDGLWKYGILTAPEQAAVVSLMAFESVDFQFNHNVSPGRPGQGTRAMLMPDNVKKYASAVLGASAAAESDPVKVLALVQGDELSFAAASWWYNTQCDAGVKSGVQTGGKTGWSNYITKCIGTTVTSEREAYWTRACQQFGC